MMPLVLFVLLGLVNFVVEGILDNNVLVVKGTNVDDHIKVHYEDGMFLYYYAPYCDSCKAFGEKYASAAWTLMGEGIVLAKMDVSESQEKAKEHGVETLPHIRWHRHGRVVDATTGVVEAADSDGIAEIARRLKRDRLGTLDTKEELAEVVFDSETNAIRKGVRAILFTKSKSQTRSFAKLADEFRYPVEFYVSSEPEWLEDSDFLERARAETTAASAFVSTEFLKAKSKVVLFKHFDEQFEVIPVQAYVKKKAEEQRQWLTKWIEIHMMPLVVHFAPQFMDLIFQGPLQVHAILGVPASGDQVDLAREAFYASAKKYRGKILHIFILEPEETDDDDDDNDEEEFDEDDLNAQHRSIWNFLKFTEPPQVIVSDMFDASESNPQGTQHHLPKEAATNADLLIEQLIPHAARAVARRAGVEPKMSEIMSEPKMQEMIKDPDMVTMFQMMGMPKELADIYRQADEL